MSQSIDLARMKDEGGTCATWISVTDEGGFRVDRFDCGPRTSTVLGGDYERWITIPASELSKLCLRLLADRLHGDLAAVDAAIDLCRRNQIIFTEGSWF